MRLLAATLACLLPCAAQGADPASAARGLVIAVNDSPGAGLAPLRFADDDGLRWHETLTRLGIPTALLTVLDDETARTSPLPAGTLPPTLDALKRSVARLRSEIDQRRESGLQTEVFLVYVGHGVVEGGRSQLTLSDGRLDQRALYSDLVDALRADYVHLVVDACHASGVVGRRGATKDPVVARIRERLAVEALKSRPTVGAVFAESEDGETHEWTRLRAGVFSFLARSALLGAGDVNGDGVVEYSELDAFLGAALQRVTAYPVRLAVSTFAPPADRRRPLARLEGNPRLSTRGEQAGDAILVEDERGVPLAGFHRAAAEQVTLLLPDRPQYWLRTSKEEVRVARADLGGELPSWQARSLQSRGPAEDELQRGLLGLSFGRSFYEGFVAQSGHVPVTFAEAPIEIPAAGATKSWSGELGAAVGAAPLGLAGAGLGVSAALKRSFGLPLVGLRAGYAWAPKAGPGELTVHRGSLELVAGVEWNRRVQPFAEVGAGWAALGFAKDGTSVGDPAVFTAHASVGAGVRAGPVQLRLSLTLTMDLAEVDGGRSAFWAPSGSLGLGF